MQARAFRARARDPLLVPLVEDNIPFSNHSIRGFEDGYLVSLYSESSDVSVNIPLIDHNASCVGARKGLFV